MKDSITINNNCWVAYFDMPGFKDRIYEFKGHLDVFRNQYEQIIEKVKESNALHPDKVSVQWFSDSFIFYCSDDSSASYVCIDLEIRHFFKWAIYTQWPLRGTLTSGELYVEKDKNICLGQVIIDACEYTEKQQWLGLVMTPMTRSRVQGFQITQINDVYTDYDVPLKSENLADKKTEKLLAFRFAHFPSTDEKYEIEFKRLSEEERDPNMKIKYDNTLKFIQKTKPKDS